MDDDEEEYNPYGGASQQKEEYSYKPAYEEPEKPKALEEEEVYKTSYDTSYGGSTQT
jgi:hypothetical protein